MNREELFEALRSAYHSCGSPHVSSKYPYMYVSCTLCKPTMDKIMEIVDSYVTEHTVFPEIMGVKEAKEVIGLSGSSVWYHVGNGNIPVVQRLATGPVFLAEEIYKFANTPRQRGPKENGQGK